MSFEVAAEAYGAFAGRYVEPLADQLMALLLAAGERALDVGCGPGTMTARLAARLGPDQVLAVDPSVQFVHAARARCPGVDVRVGTAEQLPLPDDAVDLAVAQLVVHFMTDPVAGLREMARVTRPGGLVAASVWDWAGGRGPLSVFWEAVRSLDPETVDESGLPGARQGDLERLMREAGLAEVTGGELTVRSAYSSFEEWWTPFTLGVGPAGDHVSSLSAGDRAALADACRDRLPQPPFEVTGTAWVALGTVQAPPMRVRVATDDDLDAVIEVGRRTWQATYPPIAGQEYVDRGLATWWTPDAVLPGIRDGRVRVAERDGRVVAMASYSLLDDAVMLWKLYVLPEAQGGGAGRALVDAVAEAADGRPVIRLTHLVGNDRAHAVYERMGFRETGRVPPAIDGGPEEVVMERPVSPAP